MPESEIIKFLLTGFIGGTIVTGMFWWADRDDLKRIIRLKESVIVVLKSKVLWG